MPRFPLSVSPTLDHSSELDVHTETFLCENVTHTSFCVELNLCFLLFVLSLALFPTSYKRFFCGFSCICHNLNLPQKSKSIFLVPFANHAHVQATHGGKTVLLDFLQTSTGLFAFFNFFGLTFTKTKSSSSKLNTFYSQSEAVAPPPGAPTPPPVPYLSLQAPFHSVLPQGFLMRIRGMVSFRK